VYEFRDRTPGTVWPAFVSARESIRVGLGTPAVMLPRANSSKEGARCMKKLPGFTHRQSRNGQFESICLRCYRTVARAANKFALSAAELNHQCREEDVRTVSWIHKGDSQWPEFPN
jgi:hypothetical protein